MGLVGVAIVEVRGGGLLGSQDGEGECLDCGISPLVNGGTINLECMAWKSVARQCKGGSSWLMGGGRLQTMHTGSLVLWFKARQDASGLGGYGLDWSERVHQFKTSPEPVTRLWVQFSPYAELRTGPGSGSARFRSEPKFRTELQQP